MIINCVLHAHSSFSYDSQTDLGDLAKAARDHGYACVLMSEHNNTLDDDQVEAFVARCREVSDDKLLVIPGLELSYDSNRVHLLAYGVEEFIESMSGASAFADLVREIKRQDGVAVLAHPSYKEAINRLTLQELNALDGIEVWNTRNDNRFCPDARSLRALRQLRRSAPDMAGFGGVDIHYLTRFPSITTKLEVEALTRSHVLGALRAGNFWVHGEYVSVSARGETRSHRLWAYELLAQGITRSRRIAYRTQHWLEHKGFQSPRMLVQLGRRLF